MGRRGPPAISPVALSELERFWLEFFETLEAQEPNIFKRLAKIKSLRQLYRICQESETLRSNRGRLTSLLHIRGQMFLDEKRGRRTALGFSHSMVAAYFRRNIRTIDNLLSKARSHLECAQQCLCGHLEKEHSGNRCNVCDCSGFVQPCTCGHDAPLHSVSGCSYKCACSVFVAGVTVPRRGKTIPIGKDFPFGNEPWIVKRFNWPSKEEVVASDYCTRCGHLKAAHSTKCQWHCSCEKFRTGAFRFVPRRAPCQEFLNPTPEFRTTRSRRRATEA